MLPILRPMLNQVPSLTWFEMEGTLVNSNELVCIVEQHITRINISPLIEEQYYVLELVKGQTLTPHSNFVIITEENYWLAIGQLSHKYDNEWDNASFFLLRKQWKQPKTTVDWMHEGF